MYFYLFSKEKKKKKPENIYVCRYTIYNYCGMKCIYNDDCGGGVILCARIYLCTFNEENIEKYVIKEKLRYK